MTLVEVTITVQVALAQVADTLDQGGFGDVDLLAVTARQVVLP